MRAGAWDSEKWVESTLLPPQNTLETPSLRGGGFSSISDSEAFAGTLSNTGYQRKTLRSEQRALQGHATSDQQHEG